MSSSGIYLAAALSDLLGTRRTNEPGHRFETTDLLIIASAALVVAIALVVWVAFFRRKADDDEGSRWREHREKGGREHTHTHAQHGERVRKRKRRRRREHRPRNPTLHDTGGLPPRRPEDQPPPY